MGDTCIVAARACVAQKRLTLLLLSPATCRTPEQDDDTTSLRVGAGAHVAEHAANDRKNPNSRICRQTTLLLNKYIDELQHCIKPWLDHVQGTLELTKQGNRMAVHIA